MSAVVAGKAPDFTLLTDPRMKGSLDDHRTGGLLVLCSFAGDRPGIGRSESQRTEIAFLADFDFIDREGVATSARDRDRAL